jgi:hypothetical protein
VINHKTALFPEKDDRGVFKYAMTAKKKLKSTHYFSATILFFLKLGQNTIVPFEALVPNPKETRDAFDVSKCGKFCREVGLRELPSAMVALWMRSSGN